MKTRNKIKISLVMITIIQIILLVNMTTANSYIMHQTDDLIERNKIDGEKENKVTDLINTGMNLLIGFLSIKQIGIVSASDDEFSWGCCVETTEGAICQPTVLGFSAEESGCVDDVAPTECNNLADCKYGCCIDDVQGLCSPNSPLQKCESGGGRWADDKNCASVDLVECQEGCCVLGSNVQFITSGKCEYQSSRLGYALDFRDYETELDCLGLATEQKEGACVYGEGDCNIKIKAECLENKGDFYEDYLCSNINLDTICEKQDSTNCVEGEDEIYWFDSCGNQENIYGGGSQDARDRSWNNGRILSKEDSCGYGQDNIESTTCGNCDYTQGSICSEVSSGTSIEDGDFVCQNLKCSYTDEFGNNVVRENGEAWCVYDGQIGDGKDTVGSRHWKRYCQDGEIVVEGCNDYRTEICTEYEMEYNGETFSTASCVTNEGLTCLGYNDGETGEIDSNCGENKDCMVKNINVDEYFKLDMCVPRYPLGFNGDDYDKALCGMASMECTVMYVKEFDGGWECEENCECEDRKFTEQMNDLCISMGDCGSYVNYVGKGTNNIYVTTAPEVPWEDYKKYAKIVEGQHAEPKDARRMLNMILGTNMNEMEFEESGTKESLEVLSQISGGIGTALYGFATLKLISLTSTYTVTSTFQAIMLGVQQGTVISGPTSALGAFAGAAIGFGIGFYLGSLLADALGRTGNAALALSFAGGAIGGVVGYTIAMKAALTDMLFGVCLCVPCLVIVIIAVLVILWAIFSGWGEVEARTVSFTCQEWQAPTGGDDCHICNEDELKPCSEYRCNSLGQACQLLNGDTESPTCESVPREYVVPTITPGGIYSINGFEEIDINDTTYEFVNEESNKVELRKSNGECIPEWTPVLFSLLTDEFAQCKYNFGPRSASNYEDMEGNHPLGGSSYEEEHLFSFYMPSIDAMEVTNVSGDLTEMFGNTNIYVRCQDYWGNYNPSEYDVNICIHSGPDITAAWIRKYDPRKDSYLRYGKTEENLTIWLNEPAECKYDLVEDISYDSMLYTMECKTGLEESENSGWPCKTALTNLNENENNIYIKCKDKTWVQTPENIEEYGERNVNTNDYVYTLISSESELNIDSVEPQGEIESGFEPISIDLEVETSGGAFDGNSGCYYSFESYDDASKKRYAFYDTFSDSHKQTFSTIMSGEHIWYVMCEDDAENTAYGNAIFDLVVDETGPEAIRVYKDRNKLEIITDEEAKCYYDFSKCNFDINNATSMTTGMSTKHSAEWIIGQTYHIKCKDSWSNINPNCAIIITPDYFG